MRDDAGERRGDPRIGEQCLRLVSRRPCATASCSCTAAIAAFAVATCASAIRSRPALRRCLAARPDSAAASIAAASRVDPRCATSWADSARTRSASARFTSSALRLTAPRPGHIILQLRNLEDGEQLPGIDPIANVNVDRLDVARDLGVHFDFLVRTELRRQGQRLRQIAGRDLLHRHRRPGRSRGRGAWLRAGRGGQRRHPRQRCCRLHGVIQIPHARANARSA